MSPLRDNASESRQQHWDRVYASSAPESRSWYQDEPRVSLELLEHAGIRPESRILDVGGGTSLLVDRLLDRGITNPGVLDISATAIEQARARLGERAALVEWHHTDVTRFRPALRWDVWHDRAVFHFLTDAADRAAYAQTLAAALETGGHVIIAAFSPTGPERCSGLPTVRYSAATLGDFLGPGYTWVESIPESHRTPGGKVQDFLYSRFVRRPASAG